VSHRSFKITLRRKSVAPSAKQEVNGVAVLVHTAVQILPSHVRITSRGDVQPFQDPGHGWIQRLPPPRSYPLILTLCLTATELSSLS